MSESNGQTQPRQVQASGASTVMALRQMLAEKDFEIATLRAVLMDYEGQLAEIPQLRKQIDELAKLIPKDNESAEGESRAVDKSATA